MCESPMEGSIFSTGNLDDLSDERGRLSNFPLLRGIPPIAT